MKNEEMAMNATVFMLRSDISRELRTIGRILKQLRRKGMKDHQTDPQSGYEANELKNYRSELLRELHTGHP